MSTCTDGSTKVWSHKGEEITTLYGHSQRVNGCDMSVKLSGQPEEDGELLLYILFDLSKFFFLRLESRYR